MNIKFAILSLLFLVSSFTEIIIFNEEVLLAFCFIAFVFFVYSYLSDTVFAIFDDRAKKFEGDIVFAFESKYNSVKSYANDLIVSKNILNSLMLFQVFLSRFTSSSSKSTAATHSSAFLSLTEQKLADIVIAEQKFKMFAKKSNSQSLLFSVIFKMIKRLKNPKLQL